MCAKACGNKKEEVGIVRRGNSLVVSSIVYCRKICSRQHFQECCVCLAARERKNNANLPLNLRDTEGMLCIEAWQTF